MILRTLASLVLLALLGYRAIDSCEPFWTGLDKESEYWTVFRGFVRDMKTGPSQLPKNAHTIKI